MILASFLALAVLAAGALAQAAHRLSRRNVVAGRLPSPPDAGGVPAPIRPRRPLPAPPPRVAAALADADIGLPAPVAWTAWLGITFGGLLLALLAGGPGLAGVAAVALVAGPALVVRSRRGRANDRIEQALPVALEAVARSLRSGASLRQAVEEAGSAGAGAGTRHTAGAGTRHTAGAGAGTRHTAGAGTRHTTGATGPAGAAGALGPEGHLGPGGDSMAAGGAGQRRPSRPARPLGPLAAELSRAAAEAAQGTSLVAALEAVAARRPLPGVRLGVAALCLGAETGGAQARAVDGVAATVRERLAVAAELRALSSQARMSALVIGLAPVGFGGFAAATDPRTAQFMFHTPAGLGLLAGGLVLDALGWLWMQRLARVAV